VIADPLEALAEHRASLLAPAGRPFVTLAYAQSLDGSIAQADGRPLALSSSESREQTHRLRAAHAALLVGIGTVLADDPQLTVRLVPGEQPQPVVLDTHLRLPPSALVLQHPRRPLLAAVEPFPSEAGRRLQQAGAELVAVKPAPAGVDLEDVLQQLATRGLTSVMVEGGSRVLHSFLSKRLVDWVVVTLAPRFVAGRPALVGAPNGGLPALHLPAWAACGPDVLVWGAPVWTPA
jgi:3,4-dihydroxy 2-butanone 4-phosphate synthase/GTP cyclohydrolase II